MLHDGLYYVVRLIDDENGFDLGRYDADTQNFIIGSLAVDCDSVKSFSVNGYAPEDILELDTIRHDQTERIARLESMALLLDTGNLDDIVAAKKIAAKYGEDFLYATKDIGRIAAKLKSGE